MTRRHIPIAALLAALVGCSTHQDSPSTTAGAELPLRVLATHDFHGTLRPTTYEWSKDRPVGGGRGLEGDDGLARNGVCVPDRPAR